MAEELGQLPGHVQRGCGMAAVAGQPRVRMHTFQHHAGPGSTTAAPRAAASKCASLARQCALLQRLPQWTEQNKELRASALDSIYSITLRTARKADELTGGRRWLSRPLLGQHSCSLSLSHPCLFAAQVLRCMVGRLAGHARPAILKVWRRVRR